MLMDVYLFPGQPHWSAWASLLIGLFGMIIYHASAGLLQVTDGQSMANNRDLDTVQEIDLESKSISMATSPDDSSRPAPTHDANTNTISYIKTYVVNNLKTYYLGFVVVNAWRGLWFCQDLYVVFPDVPRLSPWVSHLGGILLLLALSHFQSVLGPPYSHLADESIV